MIARLVAAGFDMFLQPSGRFKIVDIAHYFVTCHELSLFVMFLKVEATMILPFGEQS